MRACLQSRVGNKTEGGLSAPAADGEPAQDEKCDERAGREHQMRHHDVYLVVPPACVAAAVCPPALSHPHTPALAVGHLVRSASGLSSAAFLTHRSVLSLYCCWGLIPLAVPSHGDILVLVGARLEHLPVIAAVDDAHCALENDARLENYLALNGELVAVLERGKAC